MEAQNFHAVSVNKGYINYNGKIVAVTVNRICYNPGEETYYTEFISALGKFAIEDEPCLYPTEEDAANKRNKIPNKAYEITNMVVASRFADDVFEGAWRVNDEGECVRVDSSLLEVDLTFYEDDSTACLLRKPGDIGRPEYYQTKYLCENSQDVEVIEADGTKHIRKSLRSRIALTEKQEVAFGLLKAAFWACKEAKVRFMRCRESGRLYVANGKEVKYISQGKYHDKVVDVDGLIQYDDELEVEFDLNEYSELEDLVVVEFNESSEQQ